MTTTTTTDIDAMFRVCLLNWGDDTARLVLADALDENPLPAKECKNPQCKGGQVEFDRRHGYAVWEKCYSCHGISTIPDTSRQDRAELIRVGVELEPYRKRYEGHRCGECGEMGHGAFNCFLWCDSDQKRLETRYAELLRTHERDWRPVCPACDGKGDISYGHIGVEGCYLCGERHSQVPAVRMTGTGLCPGQFVRGLFECRVPLEQTGKEVSLCRVCLGHRKERRELDRHDYCDRCDSNRNPNPVLGWRPSPWARQAVRMGCRLVPGGRMAAREDTLTDETRGQFYWCRYNGEQMILDSDLSPALFDMVDLPAEPAHLKWAPTREAALDALSIALTEAAFDAG